MTTKQKTKRTYTVGEEINSLLIAPLPKTAKIVLRGLADIEGRKIMDQLAIVAKVATKDLYNHYKFVQNETRQKVNFLIMQNIKKYVELHTEYKGINTIVKKWNL